MTGRLRRAARSAALWTLVAALLAALHCDRAVRWAAARAWSLAAPRRRSEPKHARPQIPPHPRPGIPGLGQLDVPLEPLPPRGEVELPWDSGMRERPEITAIDDPPPMARPYTSHRRPGRGFARQREEKAA